jgi:hypothetical protein
MAGNGMPRRIRRQLYGFARSVASPFTDSRRRQFLENMIGGLVIGGHVHLSKIARAIGNGSERIHAVEKRLSGHLGSEHWNMSPVADDLLSRSAAMITDDSLIVADLTDLAKYWAHALEGLGRVRDGSDPERRTAPGYMVFEAYVRVGRWQLFPLQLELMKTYSGAPTSENAEILRFVREIQLAASGKGTWVWDRGADRDELMLDWLRHDLAFIVRQRGDRHVRLADGRVVEQKKLAEELQPVAWPRRWPKGGYTTCIEVWLPEDPHHALMLVVHWRKPGAEPLLLLASPLARRRGRRAEWFVKAYRRRWGVEDATWGIKQRFHLEKFLVRTWRSIRRLLCLVAVGFFWLNLWGEERFDELREALSSHPWRLPKRVTYLFDWIATLIQQLLHPRPRLAPPASLRSG